MELYNYFKDGFAVSAPAAADKQPTGDAPAAGGLLARLRSWLHRE